MAKRQHFNSKPRMLRQIMQQSESLSDHRRNQPRKFIKITESKEKSKKCVAKIQQKQTKMIKGDSLKNKPRKERQENCKSYKKTRNQHKQVYTNVKNPSQKQQTQEKHEKRKYKKRFVSDIEAKKETINFAVLPRTRNKGQRKVSIFQKFIYDYDSQEAQKSKRQLSGAYYHRNITKKQDKFANFDSKKQVMVLKNHQRQNDRSLTERKYNQDQPEQIQNEQQDPVSIINQKYQLNRIFRKIPRFILPNVVLKADLVNFSFVSFMGASIKVSNQAKQSQQQGQVQYQAQTPELALMNKKQTKIQAKGQTIQGYIQSQLNQSQEQQRTETVPFDIIHCSLPLQMLYQMPEISHPALQFRGFIFIWVQKSQIQLGYHLLNRWGFDVVDQIVWIKTTSKQSQSSQGRDSTAIQKNRNGLYIDYNDLTSFNQMLQNSISEVAKQIAQQSEKLQQKAVNQGNQQRHQKLQIDEQVQKNEQEFQTRLSGSLLKNCKSTCLVGYKCSSTHKVDYCTKISNNLIFAPQKNGIQKPDQIYEMADLIMPGCRKLQIGSQLPSQRGWFVLQHIQKSLKRCHQCFRNDKELIMFEEKLAQNMDTQILCEKCLNKKYQAGFEKAKEQARTIISQQKEKRPIHQNLGQKVKKIFQKLIQNRQIQELCLKESQILRYYPKKIISLDLTNNVKTLKNIKCDLCSEFLFFKNAENSIFQKNQTLMIKDKFICRNCIVKQFKALKTKKLDCQPVKSPRKFNQNQNIISNLLPDQTTLVVLSKSIFATGTKNIKCTLCDKRLLKIRYFQCTACKGLNHLLCQQCFWKFQLVFPRNISQMQISTEKINKSKSLDLKLQIPHKKSSKKRGWQIAKNSKSKQKKTEDYQEMDHQWRLRMIINTPQIRMYCFNCEQQCKIPYVCCETCQNWFWCMKCQQQIHKNYAHYNNNHELTLII